LWLSVLPVDFGCVVFAKGQEFLQWHGQVSSGVVAGQGCSSGYGGGKVEALHKLGLLLLLLLLFLLLVDGVGVEWHCRGVYGVRSLGGHRRACEEGGSGVLVVHDRFGGECEVVSSADSERVVCRMKASVWSRGRSGRNDAVCK
jgi:hypothetical protein